MLGQDLTTEPMPRALEILRDLGSCPAAPFFEDLPASYIVGTLRQAGIDHRRDDFGNVIAHHRPATESSEPPIAFVAHMDHPGFEITAIDGSDAVAKAMGGVPAASLVKPTPVFALALDGTRTLGTTRRHEATTDPTDRYSDRLVRIRFELPVDLQPPVPVVFDLADFELDGDTIKMRAMDDLAGCAAILAMLERLSKEGSDINVYGVFTRAEEGGLFGARLMAGAGTLPKDTIVVSVESSSVIPGVTQGSGPVIRTGDALYTFDNEAEQVFVAAVKSIRKRDNDFKVQRQLMSGGVCEASAFALFGYSVTGMAFPLGNYHNASTSIPDPDGGVEVEYIHVSDFLGGVELLAEAAKSVARRNDRPTWLGDVADDVKDRMRA